MIEYAEGALSIFIGCVLIFWIVFVYVKGPEAIWSEKLKAANRRLL